MDPDLSAMQSKEKRGPNEQLGEKTPGPSK